MAGYRVIDDYVSRKNGKHYRVHVDKVTGKVIQAFPVKPNPQAIWTGKKWYTPTPAPIKPAPKPAAPPAPVQTDAPLDSTYMSNMNADQLQRENQTSSLYRAGTLDQTDTAEALRRMAIQKGQSRQNFNDSAAKQNSLLSGRAMQGYGQMQTGYQQRNNDMQDALARRVQDRSLQTGQIQQGQASYQQGQLSANNDRAVTNTYNNRLAMYLAGLKPKKVV